MYSHNGAQRGISRRAVLQYSALGGLALWGAPALATGGTPVIETSAGRVRGREVDGVRVFKGIPYGAPTGGDARFQAPRPAAAWSGVRDALDYGHAAPQGRSMDPLPVRPDVLSLVGDGATFSEDCLYLNVWTPALDNGKRPVMVWLHGGGFSSGAGGSPLYNGANLARGQDVVVLTINHRLNVFGYLDLSNIVGEEYADSASAGMLDIVLALEWVKQNVERFGGDPGSVTIFGESGGGRKVSVLMAMPPAQGLFHRAIVQSGSALRMDTEAVATDRAERLLAALDLTRADARQLKQVPAEALLRAAAGVATETGQFRPTTGAPSLPQHPFDPKAPATSASVPMLIGTTLTEASFMLLRDRSVLELDAAAAIARIEGVVPADAAADVYGTYRRHYPDLEPSDLLFRIVTDRGYFLDATIQAALKADADGAPAFKYSFEWEQPLAPGRTHVPHGSEIAFAFNNLSLARGDNPAPLAAVMSEAWAEFARTGDPSTRSLGTWTPYDAESRPTMILDRECRIENDPRGKFRELMLAFGSQQFAEREIAPM
jgi:para-nitrobenzyl esterase